MYKKLFKISSGYAILHIILWNFFDISILIYFVFNEYSSLLNSSFIMKTMYLIYHSKYKKKC